VHGALAVYWLPFFSAQSGALFGAKAEWGFILERWLFHGKRKIFYGVKKSKEKDSPPWFRQDQRSLSLQRLRTNLDSYIASIRKKAIYYGKERSGIIESNPFTE
jgi:hypothetical protein